MICRKPRPRGARKPLDPKVGHVILTEFLMQHPRALVRRIPKGVDRDSLPPATRPVKERTPPKRPAKKSEPAEPPRKLLAPRRRR